MEKDITNRQHIEDAIFTSTVLLKHAISAIDDTFYDKYKKKNYAEEHPELVAAFMNSASINYASSLTNERLKKS